MHKLVWFRRLQEAGCPIMRHELTDEEWLGLGILKSEEIAWHQERAGSK